MFLFISVHQLLVLQKQLRMLLLQDTFTQYSCNHTWMIDKAFHFLSRTHCVLTHVCKRKNNFIKFTDLDFYLM